MNVQFPPLRCPALAALCAACAALACGTTRAQEQVANPGDIIAMRNITPRVAYHNVPTDQDSVLSRATTFPANSFNPMMATVVSDLDLTNAHGSNGVAPGGMLGDIGMQAVTRVLVGDTGGGSIVRGAVGSASATGGIGGTISGSVTGALAPVTSALGGAK
ncbi:hypothetical protein WL21_07505 [Burkholderia ubonensis]|uniref:hypothetical protein n=1 Tax=Burkholderia ubonensis TaxID=101571 RepID=UPI00075C09EC|nr:hypothetical protein [Burkholderia ubonensis]KVO82729.1 hypothetical protein WJ81_23705 [Burkholderia ubonensis]KVZ65059.1 hypothetical protein WL20_11585 [Burkholderia ubonensis]KVZ71787.1 hypothetical protein WL21_07505 [Burkholderia ubonensis]KWC13741.1 hypothetical protein WL46_02705 [Burkholderia ubonensis]